MRVTHISRLLSLSAAVLAQDLAGLPVCAQNAAVTAATSSGCGLTDAACLCKSNTFISSLKATISGSCTGTDQQTACSWGNSACASYGVTIDCSNLSGSAANPDTTSSGTPSTPAAGTGASSMAPSVTDGAAASSLMASINSMGSTMAPSSGMMTMVSSSSSAMTGMGMGMGNETATEGCMHGCGNSTHAATSMMSKTASAPTSQYTGASAASLKRGYTGIAVGLVVTAAAFVLAFA